MKKTYYNAVDLQSALGCKEGVMVEYFTTETERSDENFNYIKPYGIEVVKKQTIDGRIYREIKRVDNVFGDILQARAVIDILYRNSVTPITVSEVLEDLYVKM